MRKIMHFWARLLVVVLMISAFSGIAMANGEPLDYALFVKEGVSFSGSSYVTGNVVVKDFEDADAAFQLNGLVGTSVDGNGKIYVNNADGQSQDYITDKEYQGIKPVVGSLPVIDFPSPAAVGTPLPKGGEVTVETSATYDVFHVSGWANKFITIDVSEGKTIDIRANKLELYNPIETVGDGTINFYIDELEIKGNPFINRNGNATVNIYLSDKKSSGNFELKNMKGHFNFYSQNRSLTISGSSDIVGNIYSGKDVILQSKQIKGLVYAPNGKLDISGNAKIVGKAVAREASLSNSGSIAYGPVTDAFGLAAAPGAPDPVPDPDPTIDPTPSVPTPPEEDLSVLKFSHAYLYGYGWGDVGAEEYLTKEEVSAVLYRLLKQNNKTGSFVKPATTSYIDLPADSWSFSSIEYLTSVGVFDGSAERIHPGSKISRAETARIITLALGIPLEPDAEQKFDDLGPENSYFPYIMALVKKGVIDGMDETTVAPGRELKRAEFIKMVNILIGRDDRYDVSEAHNPYPDLNTEHWAYEEILRASYGFDDAKQIDPSKKLPREQLDYN